MTTLLIINAVTTVLGASGLVAFLAREQRRARRNVRVQPLYITTRPSAPRTRR
jgi:hypothetical protein